MKTKLFISIFFIFCVFFAAAQPPGKSKRPAYTRGITFADAAEMALAASTELQNAYAVHGIGGAVWELGRYAYFPRLTFTAYEDERLSMLKADSFSKSYTAGVDQLIFDGGRLLASRRIEKTRLLFEEKQIERMADSTALAAVGAYRQVLASRYMLQIRMSGLDALLKQRGILQSEVELGLALTRDLTEADINISQAKIEIIAAEIELGELEKQFAENLGLDVLPELVETINIDYKPALPSAEALRSAAESGNPDIAQARLSIKQKEQELKFARLSWLPTIHASGNFSLAGNTYPLTHYNWSAGLTLEFATPWISLGGAASTGMEGANNKTFRMQGTSTLMPDPVSSMTPAQARVALDMEQRNYRLAFERLGRGAESALEKCRALIQKRDLAVESKKLSEKKLDISKLKHELGQLTSIELIEDQIEHTKKELAVVQAVIDMLNGEHELEKLAGLGFGALRALISALETDL
jgi:outer membrane protein TolC